MVAVAGRGSVEVRVTPELRGDVQRVRPRSRCQTGAPNVHFVARFRKEVTGASTTPRLAPVFWGHGGQASDAEVIADVAALLGEPGRPPDP